MFFDGNISGNGGAIYNNGATITFQGTTFATSGDSIHTNKAGALIFKGNNTLCGNITGGSVTITLSGAVLTIGSGVSFSKVVTAAVDTTNEVVLKGRSISFASGQTFENISVTVDVSDWLTAGNYTIAANVGGIDSIDDVTVIKNTSLESVTDNLM